MWSTLENVGLFKDQDPKKNNKLLLYGWIQNYSLKGTCAHMHTHTHTQTHKSKKTMSVYMKIQECFWILKKMKTKTAWVWEILGCPDQTSTSSWDSWISHLCKRGSTALFQGDLVSCETIKNFLATVVSFSMSDPTDVVLGELFFFSIYFY